MIYDRTLADVKKAQRIRETKVKNFETLSQSDITALERGFLTNETLNRIENKQTELKNKLQNAGYWNNEIENSIWTEDDYFILEDWQRVLHNQNILKNSYYVYADTSQTPTEKINYTNLNAIEKLLVDIDEIIDKMKAQYRKCGTFKCGE